MEKTTQTDVTAVRLGRAMQKARRMCQMSTDDLAGLLRIMPSELTQYERGSAKIPQDILERTFVLGYKMMQVRTLEYKYRMQRSVFRKLKGTIATLP